MGLKFWKIPARGCEQIEAELNAFLGAQRILSVDRRFVEAGENSFWALCIDYLDGATIASSRQSSHRRPGQIDYREVLSPEDFSRFSELRTLRKELATDNAVPVYSVMTNEQMARIVQEKITDRRALLKIPGLGEAKVAKYGDRIVAVMHPDGSGSA